MGTKLFITSKSDRNARLFVWGIWLSLLLISLSFMLHYGSKIPLAEDWLMVAPLTGKEPDLVQWAWSQVNEHRIPFPRLMYLVLLQVTGGDFRSGGFFNIFLLGTLAAAMIIGTCCLRGNRTHYSDAFFPLMCLHLGHSANLLMGWQITQVLPAVLIGVLLLIFFTQKTFTTPAVAVFTGSSLILLPLFGANGLLYIPFLATWLSYCSVIHWYATKDQPETRWISLFLISSVVGSLALTVLYFLNYQRAYWNPPSPGLSETFITGIKLMAFGWGPIASSEWAIFGVITFTLLLATTIIVICRILWSKGLERHQAIGILFFFMNTILFSLAVGHARAGWVPTLGLPIRYVIFAIPTFCAVFLIWEFYGTPKFRLLVQRGLMITMLLLLPFNTIAGFYGFTNWYREESIAIENDILDEIPASVLAAKWKKEHYDFIEKSLDEDDLLARLKMLHDAGIKPFSYVEQIDS